MSPTQPLPPKKEVALALLERASVYVHLDPRQAPVVVPQWFKKKPQLVLQIGLNMPVPIPDLRLDDDGLSCTLSFSREPFYCVVPWSSVFALVGDDGRGMVWPDDVPAEVARQAQDRGTEGLPRKDAPKSSPPPAPAAVREAKADAPKPRRTRKRPQLAAVPDGSPPASGAPPASHAPETPVATQTSSAASVPQVPAAAARAATAPSRPVAAPPLTPRSTNGAPRKKRDLPPYLRVVK